MQPTSNGSEKNIFPNAATSGRFSLNRWYTYGHKDEVILIDNNTKKKTTVITKNGEFTKFPGIRCEDFWTRFIGDGSLDPVVRYRTEFDQTENKRWLVLWTVQPDGRYWADDDGFGGNSDPEILLYSYLASDGGFTNPFQVYRVGVKNFFQNADD